MSPGVFVEFQKKVLKKECTKFGLRNNSYTVIKDKTKIEWVKQKSGKRKEFILPE